MQNDLTKLLGIEYPIVQGGMMMISGPELTAAVSNAGGLGTLGQSMDVEVWRADVKKTGELTDKPFAVNLPLHTPDLDKKLEIIAEEGVKIVVTAAGNPARLMGPLREAGCKVMHVIAAVKQAEKVAAAGVDAIVAEGGESGGMVAKDRVSTMVLVPLCVDRVSVPVIAAGGIADVRGLVAALALGAQGVQVGTAFINATECAAGDDWKEAIVKATDTDTEVLPRGPAQGRMLKKHLHQGAMAGQVSGMIDSVESTAAIVERLVKDAGAVMEKVAAQLK